MLFRFLRCSLALTFIFNISLPLSHAWAAPLLGLPEPGARIALSAGFEPVLMKGVMVHKDNPFLLEFIVDQGEGPISPEALKAEGDKLIKYFLASLAIPEQDLWVNLSPYEQSRTVSDALGQTDMGRDLLAQDYVLKQMTASLIYPESGMGKEFWNRVYAQAQAKYGHAEVPVNTFNKVWITADRAKVYERGQTAFVVDCHLKVMLEEDYLAQSKNQRQQPHNENAQLIREIVLPELEKEVNTGKHFANLRQMFHSLILASWYKRNLKHAVLNHIYSDKKTVSGIDIDEKSAPSQIYERYLQAYKKGVFNFIKDEKDASGQITPRKYFSGGMSAGMASQPDVTRNDAAMISMLRGLKERLVQVKTILFGRSAKRPKVQVTAAEVGFGYSNVSYPVGQVIAANQLIIEQLLKIRDGVNYGNALQIGEGYDPTSQKPQVTVVRALISALRNYGIAEIPTRAADGTVDPRRSGMFIQNGSYDAVNELIADLMQLNKTLSTPLFPKVNEKFEGLTLKPEQISFLTGRNAKGDVQYIYLNSLVLHKILNEITPQVLSILNEASNESVDDTSQSVPLESLTADIEITIEEASFLETALNFSSWMAMWYPSWRINSKSRSKLVVTIPKQDAHELSVLLKQLRQEIGLKRLGPTQLDHAMVAAKDLHELLLQKIKGRVQEALVESLRSSTLPLNFFRGLLTPPPFREALRKDYGGSEQDINLVMREAEALLMSTKKSASADAAQVADAPVLSKGNLSPVLERKIAAADQVIDEMSTDGETFAEDMRIWSHLAAGIRTYLLMEKNEDNPSPEHNMTVFLSTGTSITLERAADLLKEAKQRFDDITAKSSSDAAMINAEDSVGGIDLNPEAMAWEVSKDGKGVEMNVDPAVLEKFKQQGIEHLTPRILNIQPVGNIWQLIGKEEGQAIHA